MTFEDYYDSVLNVAKDPAMCRQFWEAGVSAGRADLERVRAQRDEFRTALRGLVELEDSELRLDDEDLCLEARNAREALNRCGVGS